MQSVKHALLYGGGVWVLLVVVSSILFSLEDKDAALFESIKLLALVAIVAGFVVAYLRQVQKSTLGEGLLVGTIWLIISVALDMGLYALGLFNIGLGYYFKDVASSYLVMPLLGGLIMATLRSK